MAEPERPRVEVIGLTGGIGVGKSTVAAIMAELGACVVDCDQLGRLVVEPGGRAYDGVIDHFGTGVVGPNGDLDRGALASLVFADQAQLAALNAITHPAIDAEIARCIDEATTAPVVLDMAVLVETDLGAGQYQQVVVVEAPLAQRLERLRHNRNMSDEQSLARIDSQADDEQRRAEADHVIVNDGSEDQLRATVESLWRANGWGSA